MKEDRRIAPAWRMYPHIVTQRRGRDVRHDLHITNEPLGEDRAGWHAAYAFSCAGAIDAAGTVTETGRAAIVEQLRARVHRDDEMCVVWGPRSCSYVSHGGVVEGVDPPDGAPSDVNAIARSTPTCPDGVWIDLPKGARATHLFIRRLTFDRVEIATAAPILIADLDQPLRDGEPDAFADWFSPEGDLVPRRSHRGMEVTGMDGWLVLGPVQPDGEAFRVVQPWPSAIRAACLELAGRPLPVATLAAVWREVERMERGPVVCGSRRAA